MTGRSASLRRAWLTAGQPDGLTLHMAALSAARTPSIRPGQVGLGTCTQFAAPSPRCCRATSSASQSWSRQPCGTARLMRGRDGAKPTVRVSLEA